MKNKFNLQEIGMPQILELYGNVRIIRKIENAQIIFLFDENHDNPNDCFNKNIENAKELIDKANIGLIGVEGITGGKEWDQYNECYTNKNEGQTKISTHLEFASSILEEHPNLVVGVDSFGLCGKIESDFAVNHPRAINREVRTHPFQKERSKHFIRTLIDIKKNKNIVGNMILNCGSDHNNHIRDLINCTEFDEQNISDITFVRLNSYE